MSSILLICLFNKCIIKSENNLSEMIEFIFQLKLSVFVTGFYVIIQLNSMFNIAIGIYH